MGVFHADFLCLNSQISDLGKKSMDLSDLKCFVIKTVTNSVL